MFIYLRFFVRMRRMTTSCFALQQHKELFGATLFSLCISCVPGLSYNGTLLLATFFYIDVKEYLELLLLLAVMRYFAAIVLL